MKSKTIFLIDDDGVINYVHKKILEANHELQIFTFTKASEALEQIDPSSFLGIHLFPDIIFLDINMSPMDGWEFLKHFEKLPITSRSKCDVIILTSSIDQVDIDRSKTFEVVKGFISKPLTLEVFASLNKNDPIAK